MGLESKQGLKSRLLYWLKRRIRPIEQADTERSLCEWLQSPMGKALLEEQQEQLDDVLRCLFGYHLLVLSPFNVPQLGRGSKINHKVLLSASEAVENHLQATFEQLPLQSEAIDVVVVHHGLDYAQHPHQVLREAARVLIPKGYLVVVGFNPWSFQGLFQMVKQWGNQLFWRRHVLRHARVNDWLRLLDCEPVTKRSGFARMPLNTECAMAKQRGWERLCQALGGLFSGYYIVVARKDVVGMTPIRSGWSDVKPVVGLAMGKPAARAPEVVCRDKPRA